MSDKLTPDDATVRQSSADESAVARGSRRFAPGEMLAGRYQIVAPLGRGGMGEVYRAYDVRLHHDVALKFLPERATLGDGMLERLVDEVRIGRQVAHPNVCRLYDLVDAGNLQFIAMELVDGEDLGSLLRRIGRLSSDKALSLARDLAAGLAAAHDLGVIHRDLKPANVMIDGRGQAKITDFGLAIARDDARHEFAGTPAYMAPEQLDARPADTRSDVYSLGLVLYEMFSGRRLFDGGRVAELQRQHERPKPRMAAFGGDLDPAIEAVILSCLEEAPERRPASARHLLERLSVASGSTPAPRQPSRTSAGSSSGAADARSIAVLPFEDLSPEQTDDYFSVGLAEEIISDLAKIKSLRVISRGSVMRFRGVDDIRSVAGALQVGYVLTGSLRKAGTQLRVTANLVDGRNDTIVWSEKFRGTLDDIFDIQETVARAVAEQLKVTLTAEERSTIAERPIPNALAFDYYLKAMAEIAKFTRDGVTAALDLLQKALEILGENAPIYAAMANAKWQLFNAGIEVDEAHLRSAEELAAKIARLDPRSHYPARIHGLVAMSRGDLGTALEQLHHALALDPHDSEAAVWLGMLHAQAGHPDLAEALSARVKKLDPFGPMTTWPDVFLDWFGGRFEQLADRGRREWDAAPDSVPVAYSYVLGLLMARDPRMEEALAELTRAFPGTHFADLLSLQINAFAGRTAEARRHLTPELERAAQHDLQYSLSVAEGLAQLGEIDRAFEYLDNSIERGCVPVEFLTSIDWLLDPLRDDPRFPSRLARARQVSAALRARVPATMT